MSKMNPASREDKVMLRTLSAALLAASMIVAPALAAEKSAPSPTAAAPSDTKAATADKGVAKTIRHAHRKHVRHVKHVRHLRHVVHVKHTKHVKHVRIAKPAKPAATSAKPAGTDQKAVAAPKPATRSGTN